MSYMHIGEDFTPPDVEGKVSGTAKYAEDYKKDGMVFARIYSSPLPRGRVTNIDSSEALAMEEVVGIITADDFPPTPAPGNPALANDITYVGQPIYAIAATSDQLAEDAMAKVNIQFERMPFVTDPLDSLVEGGPDAYPEGNVGVRTRQGTQIRSVKWSVDQMESFKAGREPTGEFTSEWSYGDLEAEFAQCKTIIEEPFVTIGYPHHSLEPRSGMAYWEGGKCYFHGSLQSQSFADNILAAMLGIDPANLVFINENTGGGFGSKIAPYPTMAVTGNFSRMLNRPVQLRITREQEFYIGSARSGMQGWIKVGLKEDGVVAAIDVAIVNDAGATGGGSASSSAGHLSIVYQPNSMRFRGIPIFTNTTPRGAQRGPGQNEMAAVVAPIMDRAANLAGIDRVAFRRINAPDNDATLNANQSGVTSAYMKEAIDKAAGLFNWQEKINKPKRNGSKVRGIGVGQGYHAAGANGYDGLLRIAPDGKIYLHSGVGNLGTYSYAATVRAAAEVLKCNWDNCEIVMGRTDRHLPHSSYQGGSNTIFTHTRANYMAATDAVNKMKEIAVAEFGGNVEDYDIGDERVFKISDSSQGMSYAEAAQKAVAMGGKYSGMEYPEDINPITQRAVQGLQGTGLIGVAKDTLEKSGTAPGLIVSFTEIELDLDTGKYEILDYVAVADCGTVVHPQGFSQGMNGGAVWGIGMAGYERHVYDPQNGLPAATGLHQAKPATYLDVPANMVNAAVNIADPQNPMGARGIGEPAQGCSAASLMSAISDALDGHLFNRTPVTADMIVNHVAQNDFNTGSLKTNTF